MFEQNSAQINPLTIKTGEKATIMYVWHDCFILAFQDCCVIFDYFSDPTSENRDGYTSEKPMFLDYIRDDIPLYIIVSHHHKDHFNPTIFEWEKRHPNIKYMLSRDTYFHSRHYVNPDSIYSGPRKVNPKKVFRIKPGENFSDENIEIRAYRSTDTGNAYSLHHKASDLTAFHAGDLNAWTWRDESTEQEINKTLGDYKSVIRDIENNEQSFDIAMFPVDPRIGTGYYEGAHIFLEHFKTRLFIPMHYCIFSDKNEKKRYELLASDFGKYATDKCNDYRLPMPYHSISI